MYCYSSYHLSLRGRSNIFDIFQQKWDMHTDGFCGSCINNKLNFKCLTACFPSTFPIHITCFWKNKNVNEKYKAWQLSGVRLCLVVQCVLALRCPLPLPPQAQTGWLEVGLITQQMEQSTVSQRQKQTHTWIMARVCLLVHVPYECVCVQSVWAALIQRLNTFPGDAAYSLKTF